MSVCRTETFESVAGTSGWECFVCSIKKTGLDTLADAETAVSHHRMERFAAAFDRVFEDPEVQDELRQLRADREKRQAAAAAAPETSPADVETISLAEVRAGIGEHPEAPRGYVLAELRRLVENDDFCTDRHAGQAVLVDALRLIAGDKCSNFTAPWRCSDPTGGRTRGARSSADAWCDACIAQDALDRAAPPTDTTPSPEG